MVAISVGSLFPLLPALLLCCLPPPALSATCNTSLSPSQCTVVYGSSLQITCLDREATSVVWYACTIDGNDIIESCSKKPVCTLHNVQWPNSGLYTCSIAQNQTASLNYTATVTVQAPPYLKNQESCDSQTHTNCSQNHFFPNDAYNPSVGVVFEGVGEFNVSWTYNGSPLHCSIDTCVRRDTNNSSTIILSTTSGTAGVYTVNVSNALGWNSSIISVTYLCGQESLPSTNFTQYTHVQSGHSATVICPGNIPNDAVIRMCYVPGHGSSTVNQSQDCVECRAFKENKNTKCGDIPGRGDWIVTRTETPAREPCKTDTVSTLTIPVFEREDEGMVLCYSSRSSSLGSQFYAVQLIPDNQSHNSVTIIAAVTVGVVSVVLVSLLLVCVAKRHWQRKSMHSNGSPTAESGIHEREGRESDVEEETPTERTGLILDYDHPPYHDREVRHPPRHSRPIAVRPHYGSFTSDTCTHSSFYSQAAETEAPLGSCSELYLPPEPGTTADI